MNGSEPHPTYHVLLVGIDHYAQAPLAGCVNDIDAVQRVLRTRLALPDDQLRIRRLVSPRPGTAHDPAIPGQSATLDNLHAALENLASDTVKHNDRVFIYYSGHGARVEVVTPDQRRLHREALVPVDCTDGLSAPRLMFDFELNELLGRIVARTRSVSVVLDCCHAAGATRTGFDRSDRRSRYLDLSRVMSPAAVPDPAMRTRGGDRDAFRIGLGIEDCHVVSACMNHELAQEDLIGGTAHGLFTRAFLTALEAETASDLRALTWARIWQPMRAELERRNPWQHMAMTGNAARAVFGGAPVDCDPGIPIERDGEGYRIAAGKLSGIDRGTVLAVYGEHPPYFPPLDSEVDAKVRVGRVRVDSAEPAIAYAVADGMPSTLPHGARARLLSSPVERLRCAVTPHLKTLEDAIAASPLLELVDASSPGNACGPEVWLEQRDTRWFLTDMLHGFAPGERTLFALQQAELDCARAVLEHYHAYARPLRMASLATDLPGGLELSVLSCPDRGFSPSEAQTATLPEAPTRGPSTYALLANARVCFQVRNRSPHPLRVTLLNSAASGKVQMLGDQQIDPGSVYTFWAGNSLGSPFQISPPPESTQCIDRLVAIGRTAMKHDLGYLRVDHTFAQVIQRTRSITRGPRDAEGVGDPAPPIEQWTAAQAIIETRR
jgi:hypothetical protein